MSRSNGLMAERAAKRLLPSECLVEEVARSAVATTRTVQAPKHLHHSRLYSWAIGERAKHLGLAPFQERTYSEGVATRHHLRACRLKESREELDHLLGLGGGLLRTVALSGHAGRIESAAKDQECGYCGRYGQAGRVAARKEAEAVSGRGWASRDREAGAVAAYVFEKGVGRWVASPGLLPQRC